MLVTVTEAKARLGELLCEAADEGTVVVRYRHPADVLVGAERYDVLIEELEDLKDRLSVHESVSRCTRACGPRPGFGSGSTRWRPSWGCGSPPPSPCAGVRARRSREAFELLRTYVR